MTSKKRARSAIETKKPSKKPRRRDVQKRKQKAQEPLEQPKTKRPDVSERKRKAREYQSFVVKTSLRGRIAPFSYTTGVVVREIVEQYVDTVSRMTVRASMVANEAILEYLRGGVLPQVDSTFFRHCMVAESSDPVITRVLEDQFQDHPEITRVFGDWAVINYAANQLYTNFDNDLWMRFDSRFASYVRDWLVRFDYEEGLCASIVGHVMGRPSNSITVLPQGVWEFMDVWKAELRPTDEHFVAEGTSSAVLLKCLYRILEFRNTYGLSGRFSLVPLNKVRRHHVTIDTTTLYKIVVRLFKSLGEDTPRWAQEVALLDERNAIKEYRDMMWSQLSHQTRVW
jgi:hypothetical protein